jgi:TetR/AcrR family transcriptional regulator, transcriptional repressor for nem operon
MTNDIIVLLMIRVIIESTRLEVIASMRLSQAQTAHNHERIIDTASRLFRERGFDGVGLADVMKAAGFTHGGFYNHFQSKEALAAIACAAAMNSSGTGLAEALGRKSKRSGDALSHYVTDYLSPRHRDDLAGGCPFAALAADVARGNREIQTAFAEGVEEFLATLATYLSRADSGYARNARKVTPRERAARLLCEMVGALVLARAVAGAKPALSDELLRTNRQKLRV